MRCGMTNVADCILFLRGKENGRVCLRLEIDALYCTHNQYPAEHAKVASVQAGLWKDLQNRTLVESCTFPISSTIV